MALPQRRSLWSKRCCRHTPKSKNHSIQGPRHGRTTTAPQQQQAHPPAEPQADSKHLESWDHPASRQPPRRQVHKRHVQNSDCRTGSSSLSPRQLNRRPSLHETEWHHPEFLVGWHQTRSPHPWRPQTVSRPILLLSASLPPDMRRCRGTAVLIGSRTSGWGEAEVPLQVPETEMGGADRSSDAQGAATQGALAQGVWQPMNPANVPLGFEYTSQGAHADDLTQAPLNRCRGVPRRRIPAAKWETEVRNKVLFRPRRTWTTTSNTLEQARALSGALFVQMTDSLATTSDMDTRPRVLEFSFEVLPSRNLSEIMMEVLEEEPPSMVSR